MLAGCGGGSGAPAARTPSATPAATGVPQETARRAVPEQADADGTAAGTILFFRRYRYAGATVIKLSLHRDGRVAIDSPSGGVGRKAKRGQLQPDQLRAARRLIARVPWGHLSHRTVRLDGSGGYYLIKHDGRDLTARASGMSADLIPLVRRMNRIVDSPANETTFRFLTAG